jgi:hypothetical protein
MKVTRLTLPLVLFALGMASGMIYARTIDMRDVSNPKPTPIASATPKPVTVTNSYHVQENIQSWGGVFAWESWCNYELSDGSKERRKVATFSVEGDMTNRGQMTVQGLCRAPGEVLR